VVVFAVLNFRLERVIESVGRIVVRHSPGGALPGVTLNCQIYTDNSKTATLSFIDWGTRYPGEAKTHNVYVFNSGSVPFVLGLSTERWVPSNASDYIHLSWDYDGGVVQPNMGIAVTLTLKVDSNITGVDTFAFDIVFTVTQT
jgi:hypothetical protein